MDCNSIVAWIDMDCSIIVDMVVDMDMVVGMDILKNINNIN